MKSFALAAASLLILSVYAKADWVIEAKVESPQLNSATVTKIKGDKIRADIASGPLGPMSSIIDGATGDATQLMHAQKMAMKTSAAQMKQMMDFAKKAGGAPADAAAVKLEPTGQKENVGEYECEIWTSGAGAQPSKLWVAANHPNAAALKDAEKKMRSAMISGAPAVDTSALPGPVIKSETTIGGMKLSMTILSIKEESIDAKEFDVPADYQTMALPGVPAAK